MGDATRLQSNGFHDYMTNGDLPNGEKSPVTMAIAIIGMSCRFPGEASNPEKLWELCVNARNTWSEIPKSRFNQKAFYHPMAVKLGTVSTHEVAACRETLLLTTG